ncbi:4804_t:CDS:2, partial [Funneliformis caledonium]
STWTFKLSKNQGGHLEKESEFSLCRQDFECIKHHYKIKGYSLHTAHTVLFYVQMYVYREYYIDYYTVQANNLFDMNALNESICDKVSFETKKTCDEIGNLLDKLYDDPNIGIMTTSNDYENDLKELFIRVQRYLSQICIGIFYLTSCQFKTMRNLLYIGNILNLIKKKNLENQQNGDSASNKQNLENEPRFQKHCIEVNKEYENMKKQQNLLESPFLPLSIIHLILTMSRKRVNFLKNLRLGKNFAFAVLQQAIGVQL